MKLENLSDKDLAKIASNIETENKRRANRKAAAAAILTVLKEYKLSIDDIPELGLAKRPSKVGRRRSVATRAKATKAKARPTKKADKRIKVAYKYKNPEGRDKWSGRGRAPKWVNAILENNKISITQFKADRRYKI